MEKVVLMMIICVTSLRSWAQLPVADAAILGQKTAAYVEHTSVLKAKKKAMSDMVKNNTIKLGEYEIVKSIESNFDKAKTTVKAVIRNSKDVIRITQAIDDIYQIQSQIMDLGQEQPELFVVAYDLENAVVRQLVELTKYLSDFALKGGEKNMLNNAERAKVIIHVLTELQEIRVALFMAERLMKRAKYAHKFNKSPNKPFQDKRAVIALDIINEYKQ
ncbi:hypothetical protein PEDI_51830 [Persicobacter diffluens]|uniref:Uncharacterized protein n=2 Tax=Persicobacter diffluens TaxID=981 RepID=A0AAN5APT0_9BACT|nr:hypothetical protein PEDI_51830 [Persicobacter diffluens]